MILKTDEKQNCCKIVFLRTFTVTMAFYVMIVSVVYFSICFYLYPLLFDDYEDEDVFNLSFSENRDFNLCNSMIFDTGNMTSTTDEENISENLNDDLTSGQYRSGIDGRF